MVPHLVDRRTVITFDRRGRGQSGDTTGRDYSVEDEFDDVAAIVNEVASWDGAAVDVFGHSFGAYLALGGAMRTDNVRSLVAYSPGFGAKYPTGSLERIESSCNSDDTDGALVTVLSEIIGMSDQDVAVLRDSPVWQTRMRIAGTVPRECRADETYLARYGEQLKAVDAPVLVVDGVTNVADKRESARRLAALLPNARLVEMANQGHAAHHAAPKELADIIVEFNDSRPPAVTRDPQPTVG
jgi:pimeloyl-ACP methyl ester carboxylesterase